MSANVETMAYAGEVPWHGLGVKIEDTITPEDLLVTSGLDWNAVKRPLKFVGEDGKDHSTGTYALVRDRDNKVLSASVSKGWKPVQNKEALGFFQEFCDAGTMKMETAGSLSNGQFVFALARIQESFTLPGQDKVDAFLLFSNPHKVGNSINVQFTPIRVVCSNTLAMALDGESSGRFRSFHTATFSADEAKEALGLAKNNFASFKGAAQFLASKRWDEEKLHEYFKTLFPANTSSQGEDDMAANGFSRRAAMCAANMDSQPGAEMSEGTWWQAFNAVTFATDHLFGRSNDTRMKNSWFGWTRQRKQEALTLATKFANAA